MSSEIESNSRRYEPTQRGKHGDPNIADMAERQAAGEFVREGTRPGRDPRKRHLDGLHGPEQYRSYFLACSALAGRAREHLHCLDR